MKQYVIDELRPGDADKIRKYLSENVQIGPLPDVYWVWIQEEMLDIDQRDHHQCQPHYWAIEISDHHLACELLIRSSQRMRCNCVKYANETQRNIIIQWIESLLVELNILT